MKKYILFFFLPVLLIGLHACDEGRIYENAVVATGEGRTVKMTGRISGVDKWSGDYSVVVAGFDDESDYAIVSKVVPASESDNDEIQLTMSGITDEVTTVELCVINKLRKRIVSLVAMKSLILYLWMQEQLMQVCTMPFNKKYSMPLVRLAMVLAPLRVVA